METPEIRRKTMQAVKSENTSIEIRVRKLLHARGYRYRLHGKDLPGKPDIIFPGRRKVVFVNGCFWHGHTCPRGARKPVNNAEYWTSKIARNMARDSENTKRLRALGWSVFILWECELKDETKIIERLCRFLDAKRKGDLPG
jgi:DNA mismatch endonuclease (patch repair protein)